MPSVEVLRSLGHDVITAVEAGWANQGYPDVDALAFAMEKGRIMLTNDRYDFRALHAAGHLHVGIVEFTSDADFAGLAHRIDAALGDPRAAGRFYASVTKGGHTFR